MFFQIEKQVCLSTAKFEDFIIDFLNRIFQIISLQSAEALDSTVTQEAYDQDNDIIKRKISSIIFSIVQNCSNKIFQVKIMFMSCF